MLDSETKQGKELLDDKMKLIPTANLTKEDLDFAIEKALKLRDELIQLRNNNQKYTT
jgi:hypothetical protein